MSDEDAFALVVLPVLSSPIGMAVGFGIGAILFDSFLKAVGFGFICAGAFPVTLFFYLIVLQPWSKKKK